MSSTPLWAQPADPLLEVKVTVAVVVGVQIRLKQTKNGLDRNQTNIIEPGSGVEPLAGINDSSRMLRALLHNLVVAGRVRARGGYLSGHEQAFSRPLPHHELA